METQPNLRWFVIQSRPNAEKAVAKALRDRIVQNGLEDQFGDVLVPSEDVIEMRAGQKRQSERKFFPGYILIQIATSTQDGFPVISPEGWHLVKNTSKVSGFIGGTAARPSPITDKEANVILARVQQAVVKPRQKVLFETGQMVRVIDGPFNDFHGVVDNIDYDKASLRVSVLIFGRATSVEFKFAQVQAA